MIYGKDINLKIKNKNILQNINFEIAKNRITGFVGNNGSGKTTLLRCILNLYKKYNGKIFYEDKNIKKISDYERAKNISFVFQELNLFNNLTVLQNCILPIIHLHNISQNQAEEIVIPILQNLNIEDIKNYYPSKISHGQKQKTAIARALSIKPKLLILDEPTAALDIESKQNFAKLLLDLNNDGMTLALTNHDEQFANLVFDRTYYIEDGKIVNFFEKN